MVTVDKKVPRQAVVLMHGIGEQRPMETLQSFVNALLRVETSCCGGPPKDALVTYYSKPDTISNSYELRRYKLRVEQTADGKGINADWPETDFYEYYWAHHMYGTTVSHVFAWLRRVLVSSVPFLRFGKTEYPRLRIASWTVWLAMALVLAIGVWFIMHPDFRPLESIVVTTGVFGLFWALLRMGVLGAFTDVVGDAARYFDVNPKNVARRYDILRGGIAMLQKLHKDCDSVGDKIMYRYGRIVLVGHSLGSVIAYDILRHYWYEVNGQIDAGKIQDQLSQLENYVGSNGAPEFKDAKPHSSAVQYRTHQHEAWCKLNDTVLSGVELPKSAKCTRWLITDLVTLGSPLAHAPVLLASGRADLELKRRLRELPTCPPDRSHNQSPGHFTVQLQSEANRIVNYPILHHGACFALTRWTNLYFSNDLVGGPVAVPFGSAIEDWRLQKPSWSPFRAHISYWDTRRTSEPVDHLRSLLVKDRFSHNNSSPRST